MLKDLNITINGNLITINFPNNELNLEIFNPDNINHVVTEIKKLETTQQLDFFINGLESTNIADLKEL